MMLEFGVVRAMLSIAFGILASHVALYLEVSAEIFEYFRSVIVTLCLTAFLIDFSWKKKLNHRRLCEYQVPILVFSSFIITLVCFVFFLRFIGEKNIFSAGALYSLILNGTALAVLSAIVTGVKADRIYSYKDILSISFDTELIILIIGFLGSFLIFNKTRLDFDFYYFLVILIALMMSYFFICLAERHEGSCITVFAILILGCIGGFISEKVGLHSIFGILLLGYFIRRLPNIKRCWHGFMLGSAKTQFSCLFFFSIGLGINSKILFEITYLALAAALYIIMILIKYLLLFCMFKTRKAFATNTVFFISTKGMAELAALDIGYNIEIVSQAGYSIFFHAIMLSIIISLVLIDVLSRPPNRPKSNILY